MGLYRCSWEGRNAHGSSAMCVHRWCGCILVLGLARLSFQETEVMRTCATAVGKQYSLAPRSAVSVYRSLKGLIALQISMRHVDSLPRCLFFMKNVSTISSLGEKGCVSAMVMSKSKVLQQEEQILV